MPASTAAPFFAAGADDGETEMTPSDAAIYQTRTSTPESLRTLASFLELALDEGTSVVVMRIGMQLRNVYVGNPSGALEDLTDSGVVDAFQADEMLVLTRLGLNRITADGQHYRFIRSVRYIADRQVVVFTPI
ncbi:hypothetical protein LJ655_02550 [Paraburkholderia sp. MMS20-SJTN17]|uniref:Uncharacterized protein n=2 Tax=Paraburkholderia translucens TaxID=2886945 RepID=A0ABS8K7S3_9BURK|nr:hypothetical protein [Paraburkholderia sp. MMS20-SJTN17]